MFVFIDESGDPGFKTDAGASAIFVAVMVIFETAEDAARTQLAIENSEARKQNPREFKFSKSSIKIRDLFFVAVKNCNFKVRAIDVRKEKIRSDRLRTDKEKFYEFFVKNMLDYDGGILKKARIIIDGSGDREFRRNLQAALRRRLGAEVMQDLRFKDSKTDSLIQLADMCAGAIARSYGTKKDAGRWRKKLGNRINDVWDFE
jgi:hypothetical protein